jgi:hypothetical protein
LRADGRGSGNGNPNKGQTKMSGYSIVRANDVEDAYADSDVPGEFRSLKDALGAEQVAVTLIRIPPHSDFEQSSGHFPAGSRPTTRPRSRTSGQPPQPPPRPNSPNISADPDASPPKRLVVMPEREPPPKCR